MVHEGKYRADKQRTKQISLVSMTRKIDKHLMLGHEIPTPIIETMAYRKGANHKSPLRSSIRHSHNPSVNRGSDSGTSLNHLSHLDLNKEPLFLRKICRNHPILVLYFLASSDLDEKNPKFLFNELCQMLLWCLYSEHYSSTCKTPSGSCDQYGMSTERLYVIINV